MKKLIQVPLDTLPLYVPAAGAAAANQVYPWPTDFFCKKLDFEADGDPVNDDLGGHVDVVLFKDKDAMEAFRAGYEIVGADDDFTIDTFILPKLVRGCRYAAVTHCSDSSESDLTVSQFMREPKGKGRKN